MNKEALIPIGEQFMALGEVINRFCPADAAEVQMAKWHLRMAYAFIRMAFGCQRDRKSRERG